MHRALRRVSATAALITLTTTVSLFTAGPAEASPRACQSYLKSRGYSIGRKIHYACQHHHGWLAQPICVVQLGRVGVAMRYAVNACGRATD